MDEAAVSQPDVVALAVARWVHHRVCPLRLPQQHRYLFAIGGDNAVWYLQGSGGRWSGWQPLGGIAISPPVATADFNGGVDVFVVGQDAAMWSLTTDRRWLVQPGSTSADVISPPAASYSQVFGIGVDGHLWAADYL